MLYTYYQTEELSPPYFKSDPNYVKLEEDFGIMKDRVVDATKDSLYSDSPYTCTDDALDLIGSDYNLERPEIFTNTQWRNKLKTAWTIWQTSGTTARLTSEIVDLGFPNVSIVPQYIEISPGNFVNTLGIPEYNPLMDKFWSNFWIVIDQQHPFTLGLWGSFTWGDGTLWGAISPSDQTRLTRIAQLAKLLKPAWTSCRGIVFLLGAPNSFWSGFNYNDGTVYGLPATSYFVVRLFEEWEPVFPTP